MSALQQSQPQPKQQLTTPKTKQKLKAEVIVSHGSFNVPNEFKGRTIPTDLPYDLVGMFRLKRVKQDQNALRKVGFYISDAEFMELAAIGQKYGVTFCEVLRGLIARELADTNSGSTLSHWIPVLNL